MAALLRALCVFLCCAAKVSAATVYTLEDGLSQNSVGSIARDPFGFIWFGTEDGLNRFDGYEFRVYRHRADAPTSLSSSFITALQNEGRALWVGSEGGLDLFDQMSEQARRVPVGAGGLPNGSVSALLRVAPGELLVGLRGAGLVRVRWSGDPSSVPFQIERVAMPDPDQPYPGVWGLQQGPSGIWIATQRGAFLISASSGAIQPLRAADLPASGQINIDEVLELPDGRLLLGGWHDGLFERARKDGAFRRISHPYEARSLRPLRTLALGVAEQGLIWVGTDRGLAFLAPGAEQLTPLNPADWADDAANGVLVYCLLVEPGGALWAGSWGEGVAWMSPNERRFRRIGVLDGLAQKRVRAVLPETDGSVLVGSFGGGVQRFGAVDNAPETVPYENGAPHTAKLVWTMRREPDGGLLVGTDDGLYRQQRGEQRLRPWRPNGWPAQAVGVRTMLRDRAGTLWVGTSVGLYAVHDEQTSRVELMAEADRQASDNNVYALLETAPGELYIGTWGGLFVRQSSRPLRAYRQSADGLPAAIVWSLATDPAGGVWLGTAGGLVHAEGPADQLRFRRADAAGVPEGPIYSIETDRRGQLWLATNGGLFRFDQHRRLVDVFRQRDGLLSDEFHVGAHAVDHRGQLYFGGLNGLVVFDPDGLLPNAAPPAPVLTRLTLGNQLLRIAQEGGEPLRLKLGYGRGPLGIDFSAIDGDRTQTLLYRYRWSGLKESWTDLDARRSVSLSALPGGDYTLQVQARSATGLSGPINTLLELQVAPPWWQQPWLWVGSVLLLSSAGVWLARYRTRAIRERNRWLSEQVTARTAELSRTADALARANVRLRELSARDGLTGLFNRRHLLELAPDGPGRHSCVLIDLDHFKSVNDRYGHAAGDRVLIDFAEQIELAREQRPQSLAGRYGGEEFLVFLPDCDRFVAAQWADHLRLRLGSRKLEVDGQPALQYSASFGVAERETGEPLDAWIARADGALYTAKHRGRDRVEIAG